MHSKRVPHVMVAFGCDPQGWFRTRLLDRRGISGRGCFWTTSFAALYWVCMQRRLGPSCILPPDARHAPVQQHRVEYFRSVQQQRPSIMISIMPCNALMKGWVEKETEPALFCQSSSRGAQNSRYARTLQTFTLIRQRLKSPRYGAGPPKEGKRLFPLTTGTSSRRPRAGAGGDSSSLIRTRWTDQITPSSIDDDWETAGEAHLASQLHSDWHQKDQLKVA